MKLGDVTGLFSRYFVVGFFLPSYISLVALWLVATSQLVPRLLKSHSEATQLAALGGIALVLGLALSGLSYYITRAFEGYPLERASKLPIASRVYEFAMNLQRRRYDHLVGIRDNDGRPPRERSRAAWCLDRFYPHDRDKLLPTRIGNAIRAFEQHANSRWGLDGVTVWPRIDALLSSDERELQLDAKINFYVFVNGAIGAVAVGVCLLFDKVVNTSLIDSYLPLYLLPFALAYLLYRAAIGPATDWGDSIRASFDLHRLEIYEKLGVRAPTSFSDERQIADRVNKALLYGHPLLPDELWRSE